MQQPAILNFHSFHTPIIAVMEQISNQEERLLEWLQEQKILTEQQNVQNKSNYIVINQNRESIGIETVRELQETLSFGSFGGQIQVVFLLAADHATIPAQNALLKLLEEPPVNTLLILTVESTHSVLETILSRCQTIYLSSTCEAGDAPPNRDTTQFINQLTTASLRELIEVADEYKEKEAALHLVAELVQKLHQNLKKSPSEAQISYQLRHLLQAQKQLSQNVNVKLALESCFFAIRRNSP